MLTSGALRAAVAFGSNLVLVRFVAPEEFGEFALRLAGIGLVLTVVALPMGTQVIRLRDDELAERDDVYWNVLVQGTLLAGAIAGAWISWTGAWTPWMAVLLAGMLLQHFVNSQIAFYERTQPYVQIAVLEGASVLASHGLAVVLVIAGIGAGALYLRELAMALVLMASLASVGGLHRARLHWLDRADWLHVLRQVRGIWLESLLAGAFQRVSVLLAGAVGSPAAVGFFYQARRLAVVPQQLLGPVTGRMALNWFSRSSDAGTRRRSALRLIALVSAPLVALAGLAVALADPVVPMLFGESWRPVVPVLLQMLGVVVFYSLFGITKTYLVAARRTRYLLIGRVVQFVGLGLPFVGILFGREVGVAHVALGLSVAYAFVFASCLYFTVRPEPA